MSKLDELVWKAAYDCHTSEGGSPQTGKGRLSESKLKAAIRAYIAERFGPLMREIEKHPCPEEVGSRCQDCHKAYRGAAMPCPFCGSDKAQQVVWLDSKITLGLACAKQE